MSVRKFRFVSPGIFINEIDRSQIPVEIDNEGPVIIGRAERGPGMVPTKVRSFSEFVEKFGNPIAGRGGPLDIWRDGNYSSPTYAGYAAQAYLRSGVGPVTFLRLMGTQHTDASATGYAGWTTTNVPDATLADNGGPYGLFVFASGSTVVQAEATLTMADGDDATDGQFTEGEYTIVTSTEGVKRVYVLCDGSETGASATGTVLTAGSDTGASTLSAATAALGVCVAVNNNLNTHSQALVLNEIKAAIVHANGHNGQITASGDVSVADGNVVITLTQLGHGDSGNNTVTTTISQLTVGGFSSGDGDNAGTLAAVWYMDAGAVPVLSGTNVHQTDGDDTVTIQAAGAVVKSDATGHHKVKIIRGAGSAVDENITFSLDESSDKFIRKAFNTNPQLVNSDIVDSNNRKYYWLGETYERAVVEKSLHNTTTHAVIMAVCSGTLDGTHERDYAYRDAHSGWFFGQNLSNATSSYTHDSMDKLFKFVGINGYGEWLQSNIKISISNIKASSNEYMPYGLFDVIVRRANDSDIRPVILERYSACTLDPASPSYVATKIGDMKQVWDNLEKRYREYGNYPNRSNYIRVVMSEEVDNGGAAASLLPFGVYGPPRYSSWTAYSGSTAYSDHPSTTAYALAGTSIPETYADLDAGSIYANSYFGAAVITYPAVGIRDSCTSTTLGDGTVPTTNAYFGLHTGKTKTSTVFDPGYTDYLTPFGRDTISNATWGDTFGLGGYGSGLDSQWVFSLDDIIVTKETSWASDQPSKRISDAQWSSGSCVAGTSWNASSSLGTSRYQSILDSKINRFTSPMFGGHDGLDITERDPFRNTRMEGTYSTVETTNYVYYTLRRAIDIVADAEVVAMNAVCVPGITNETVTKYLLDTVETRADSLAVIDLKGGFQPRHESNSPVTDRKGVLATVISNMKARNLNTSYGCTYYPWVRVREDTSGTFLLMPPSVVALGVLGNTERAADVWFAPAGFVRGGLSFGAGVLSVVGVEDKMTSQNRDDLYDVNINPIASFPAEGIVIFGQKTLQATRSALDRINVRRLLIFTKRGISRIAATTLFQPNVQATWNNFRGRANKFLSSIKVRFGIDDFKIVLDETTTTPDLIDRNIMYAKIFIKPTRAIEFIAIDFIITRSGASFED